MNYEEGFVMVCHNCTVCLPNSNLKNCGKCQKKMVRLEYSGVTADFAVKNVLECLEEFWPNGKYTPLKKEAA